MGKLFLQIFGRVATHPGLFAVSQRFAALGTHLVSPFSTMVRLAAVTGWGYSKDLPRFASKPFRARFHRQNTETVARPERTTPDYVEPTPEAPISDSQTEQFIQELTTVSGQITRTSVNELTGKVVDFFKSRAMDRIHLEPNVLDEDILQQAGITVSHAPDPEVRVGVTKAICGLADTGSILEADGEGGKIHASLLTEVHIAVLRTSDILPSLVDALPLTRQSKSAVFITDDASHGADRLWWIREAGISAGHSGPDTIRQ